MSDNEAQIQDEVFDQPIAVGGQEHQGDHEDFFGSGEAQNQHDDFGQAQEYNQDFGGHDQFQDQGYQQAQGGAAGYDDFFGGESQPQGGNQQFEAPIQQNYGGNQGGYGAYDANYDPEEEERQNRLRQREQERVRALEEKAHAEREKKQERIVDAARDLAKWHSEREQNIQKKKQINKDNQQIQNDAKGEDDYKNPWDKIVANIAVKEGEYPGTKDVTRFRQSLQNKKIDAGKGIGLEESAF